MGMAPGEGQEEDGPSLPNCPGLHLSPLRAVVIRHQHCWAWQDHLQHRNRGLFYTAYVVSTLFAAFIRTRHYVWLCLIEDSERWETSGKWLLRQVNTSAIEMVTKPQSKTRGRSSGSTLKWRSDLYISVCNSNDFITAISTLHTQLGRKQLAHFCFESLSKIRWSNLVVCSWLSHQSCRKNLA